MPGPEAKIERKCREWIESLGGRLYKVKNMSAVGWPDRMILLPNNGSIGFCEFKAPGKRPDAHQQIRMNELAELGVWVFWVDSFEGFKQEVERRVSEVSLRRKVGL